MNLSEVERVWYEWPQAHFTVAVAYTGWISGFIVVSRGYLCAAFKYS